MNGVLTCRQACCSVHSHSQRQVSVLQPAHPGGAGQDPRATALYMFPTKALAQDQLRALRELCDSTFGERAPCIDIYDGDTARVRLCRNSQLPGSVLKHNTRREFCHGLLCIAQRH